MKRLHLIILLFLFFCTCIYAQTSPKKRVLKPTSLKNEVTINVEGKQRAYYMLSAENPSVISLKGPGKLLLYTRLQFVPAQKEKMAYDIMYSLDGGEPKHIKVKAVERSNKATFRNGTLGVPGQLQEIEILLGRGNHTIAFNSIDSKIGVAVRYVFIPKKEKKREWLEFYPAKSTDIVELLSNESTIGYYRFSSEKPLVFEVIGPTELRVLTRAEFNYQMRGAVNYRIQVKNNKAIINTYQLRGRRSEIASYKKEKKLVPGKACEFVINVPEGKQVYELIPLDKDKSTILGRIMLPKKDVKAVK